VTGAGTPSDGHEQARNIILIGLRGCGKSSVGRELALRLGWPLVDTDKRIEATAGRSIREIFKQDGEASFRSLEAAVIAQVVQGSEQVISVGGGAVLSEPNRQALRAAGLCVWLTAPPEELYRRMLGDPRNHATRPALTDRDVLDEVRHLLKQREPLYAGLAHHVVETGGRPIGQVVDAVLALLGRCSTSSEGI
jgi:shikimate kinase